MSAAREFCCSNIIVKKWFLSFTVNTSVNQLDKNQLHYMYVVETTYHYILIERQAFTVTEALIICMHRP